MGFVRNASFGRGLAAGDQKKGSARPFHQNVIFGTFQIELSKWPSRKKSETREEEKNLIKIRFFSSSLVSLFLRDGHFESSTAIFQKWQNLGPGTEIPPKGAFGSSGWAEPLEG